MRPFVIVVVVLSGVIPAMILSYGGLDDRVYLDQDPDKRVVGAHEEIACSNCHQFIASVSEDRLYERQPSSFCVDCHESAPVSIEKNGFGFHRQKSRSCADCHTFHDVSKIKAGNSLFHFDATTKTRFICQSCHNDESSLSTLSEAHFAARDFFHRDTREYADGTPSDACQHCHARQVELKTDQGTFVKAIHINSAASHPIGIPVFNGMSRNILSDKLGRLNIFEGNIDCQTCHQLNSGSRFSLQKFDNPYDLCLTCHTQGRNW